MEINRRGPANPHSNMSQVQIRIQSDGSVATYAKGSFHIHHAGVTYLNLLDYTSQIAIFPESTTAEIIDGKLHVVGYGKEKFVFSPAKTIEIKVTEQQHVVKYVEGSLELLFKDEVYLLKCPEPLFSFPTRISASFSGNTIRLNYCVGRRPYTTSFEKANATDDISQKRKMMELELEEEFVQSERRKKIKHANSSRAVELADKALDALRELIEFENAMVGEAKTDDGTVFENGDKPLDQAVSAVLAVKECASELL